MIMKKQLLLLMMMLLPMVAMADNSGTCGDNLTWTLVESTGTLTISGTGAMQNFNNPNYYSNGLSPWYYDRAKVITVVIEDGVTTIGNCAFYNCSKMSSVIIHNSVTSIGNYAFYYCITLNSVTIGNGVTTIGSYAFSSCSCLTSITIPSSVTSIGSSAFSGLKKTIWLTNTPPYGYDYASGAVNYVANEQYSSLGNKIVYPFLSSVFEVDGVKYVPVSPSERTCDAIDCVYDSSAADTKITSTVSYKGVTMSVQKVQPYVCYGNTFIENLTCENDGEIAQYAFYGCKNMKTATLGDKITSIGDYAFQECASLQTIIIPNSVTTLGQYSFYNCISLTDVTIGNQVKDIYYCAFYGCKTLPKIIIPTSVTKIGNHVFSGCSSLKEFIIEDRDTELSLGCNYNSPLFVDCPLDYVYIGGDITYSTSSYDGYSPFYRNTTLRKVVITDKETEISANEFYGCTNLQSFTVGDGVEKFGDWAFSGCSSLQSLSFGTQLKTIGKEAFSDCTSVTEITSKAATPPACSTQALDDINKWNCQLYVPQGSLAAYQAADQWKEFFFISEGEGSGTTPEEKKCATPVIVYKDETISFNCETEDVTFTYEITTADVQKGSASEVQLTQTYTVSVYATKDGYEKSDVATMDIKIAGGMKGDVNADGEVNVGDIVTVTNIMAGKD